MVEVIQRSKIKNDLKINNLLSKSDKTKLRTVRRPKKPKRNCATNSRTSPAKKKANEEVQWTTTAKSKSKASSPSRIQVKPTPQVPNEHPKIQSKRLNSKGSRGKCRISKQLCISVSCMLTPL